MEKLNINQWAEEDRPREKMESQGAESLTNAELLAILIGSGSTKESAVELMKRLLSDCKNNLNTLGKMTIHDLCQYNGIGKAKAICILAACELGKRRQMENPEERPDLGTATRIYNHMHDHAGSRRGGVLDTASQSALPPHQESQDFTWRHHRDSCRYSYYHSRGRHGQLHHSRRLPQPSLRKPFSQPSG